MALFLREADVEALVDMPATVAKVREITLAQATGQAWLEPRTRLRMPKGMLHTMSAAWPTAGYFVHKAYASVGGQIHFRVFLYDAASGVMRAVIEGNRLGQLRTGAATAVAAQPCWPADATTWAVFGSGLQALGQVEALLTLGKPQALRVYSRDAAKRQAFAANCAERFGVTATAATTADAAVDGAGVVVTATTSKEPVFNGKLLAKGAFVAAVGANLLIKRELDGAALQKIDRLFVDDIETAKRESGLLQTPMEAGFMHWPNVASLPDLLGGKIPGRKTAGETLCFHSLGSATWDLAAAMLAYERAKAQNLGIEIPLD